MSMRAFAADGNGKLEEVSLPMPTPGDHDIVVKNSAISINPVDTKELPTRPKGSILGWDSCGTVTAIGVKAGRFKVGDRVWFAGDLRRHGTYAEYTAVDERICALAPKSFSDAQAAAMPLVGLTAFEGLTEQLGLSSPSSIGKTILVLPGAGGVGSAVTGLAKKMLNMTVIATASRQESIDACKNAGADHVINHRERLRPQLEALGLSGVDYVFNTYDTTIYFDQYCDIVNANGSIVTIVETNGVPLDIGKLMAKRISFHWELMYTRTLFGEPEDRIFQGKILEKLACLADYGVFPSTLSKEMKMSVAELDKAYEFQRSGKAIGKTVLNW